MTVFSAQFQGAAGSATLPFAGLRSGTSTNYPRLLEVKVFTTAANAARIRIVRLTTAGTATSITPINEMFEAQVANEATAVHTYTSTAPTIAGEIDIGHVGAAIGSGFHYTYYDPIRLYIAGAASNANGIGLVEVTDTANTYDGAFIWEE